MKRMERDNQMRDIQKIDQVHVHSGDRWRAWDGMIRREIFKTIDQVHVHSGDGWRGCEDQMGGLKTIDQVHVPTGDRWKWNRMIRCEVIKQLTKFTYILKTDEEDEMGWLDERSSNNWPSSRTNWRRMKRKGWNDQIWVLHTIAHFYVRTGDGWRWWDRMISKRSSNNWTSSRTGWRRMKRMDGMIRCEVFKQLIKFTYSLEIDKENGIDDQMRCLNNWSKFTYTLETDEEDGMGWSDEKYSSNCPNSRTN